MAQFFETRKFQYIEFSRRKVSTATSMMFLPEHSTVSDDFESHIKLWAPGSSPEKSRNQEGNEVEKDKRLL